MEDDIYQEHIMDHYQHPRQKYIQKNPTYSKTQLNPLCGDELTIQITAKTNKNIEDISFQGHGCAISQASASILTEFLHKKPITQLKKLSDQNMIDMLHIPISHTRTKCALLALKTAQAAIANTKIAKSSSIKIQKKKTTTKNKTKA